MRYPILLFDLDGTLVDSAAGIAVALSIVRQDRGGTPITAAEVRPLVSQGAEILVAKALGPLAEDKLRDLAAFRAVLQDLPPDPATIFPDVRETLSALTGEGHILAIVTNKPEGLSRTLLEGLDLAAYFSALVGGDTASDPKPHRAPLDHALRLVTGQHQHALLIGDSEVDAQAASNCAIPFILFEGGYGAGQCEPAYIAARFARFSDLRTTIAALG